MIRSLRGSSCLAARLLTERAPRMHCIEEWSRKNANCILAKPWCCYTCTCMVGHVSQQSWMLAICKTQWQLWPMEWRYHVQLPGHIDCRPASWCLHVFGNMLQVIGYWTGYEGWKHKHQRRHVHGNLPRNHWLLHWTSLCHQWLWRHEMELHQLKVRSLL